MNRFRPIQSSSHFSSSQSNSPKSSNNNRLYIILLIILAFSLLAFSPLLSLLPNSTDLSSIQPVKDAYNKEIDTNTNFNNIDNYSKNNNNNLRQQEGTRNKKKIAYAITVTKDGNFLDGALVLGYSARKIHSKRFKNPDEFDMDLIAFVTSSVTTSKDALEKFGWKVYVKDLPVGLDEIKNEKYVKKMKDSGCCGADEFLKLWAYTLTDYELVVHLDMDSILFQNMDELVKIDKEFLFTGDYNMKGGSPVPPAQGGFLAVKPSMETFKKFQEVIREGDYGSRGWGNTGIGKFLVNHKIFFLANIYFS